MTTPWGTKRALSSWSIPLLLLVTAPFMFWGGPGYISSILYKNAWNLGHVAFFCLLVWWLRHSESRAGSTAGIKEFLLLTAGLLIVGFIVEWVQYGIHRNPDWHDIWRNLLGGWLGWLLYRPRGKTVILLLGLLGMAVFWEIALIGRAVQVDRQIQRQLPLIADFETPEELERWIGNASQAQMPGSNGPSCLKLQLSTAEYSGTGTYQMPHNWRGFETLRFLAFNPDADSLSLTIRINDRENYSRGNEFNDRFNRNLELKPGWNRFSISLAEVREAPQERDMNMEDVFWLGIFAMNLPEPRVIYLDHFRLE